jgi:hypothetical protein
VQDDHFATGDGQPAPLCAAATVAAGNPVVTLYFSEALDVATVTGNVVVYIVDTADNANEGEAVTSATIDTATAKQIEVSIDLAASNLDSGDVFAVVVTEAVKDASGNSLIYPVHEFFTAP